MHVGRARALLRGALLLGLPLLFFVPRPPLFRTKPGQQLVAEILTPFFVRWVVDKKMQGEDARVLYARGDTILAVVGAHDLRSRCPWADSLAAVSGARRVLILGAGAGLAATEFLRTHSDDAIVVDAVDADARSFSLAEKYFGYPKHDRRLSSHVAKARDYLRKHLVSYDVIFVDRIAGAEVSSGELASHLASEGVAIVRGRADDVREVGTVFPRVRAQEMPRAESLITASK